MKIAGVCFALLTAGLLGQACSDTDKRHEQSQSDLPQSVAPSPLETRDPTNAVAVDKTVDIDGNASGLIFEGIGGVSAGASSRLLMDYPEAQRNEILDYLFKPNFGAAFQHLKVEIGSDAMSTDGSEPAYARSREEFENPKPAYFNRGYEWELMKQAKARNPEIYLDALEWGAPGWIGENLSEKDRWYSQDNQDYIAGFIHGAKTYHDLDINYVGLWNERYDQSRLLPFISSLRSTLDNLGLQATEIVGPDLDWTSGKGVLSNSIASSSIAAIGIHYPDENNAVENEEMRKLAHTDPSRPIWASEDISLGGDWKFAQYRAKRFNRNYILRGMTKTEMWSLIASYYNSLAFPGSGPMVANEPWSGHYTVQPAIWAIAHTTQFAQPGWEYIDSACGILPSGGTFVTLKQPNNSGNYSVIIETSDAARVQIIRFNVKNLSTTVVHVWRSNESEQFIRQNSLLPVNGVFDLPLLPNSIYTLTTTSGQRKGDTSPPPKKHFPFPYYENFEQYESGQTARYISDQVGAFEVYQSNGESKSLRQVISKRVIGWIKDDQPQSCFGDSEWFDYEVSADALIENSGSVSIFGRVNNPHSYFGQTAPFGYGFQVQQDGTWFLRVNRFYSTKDAAGGSGSETWHTDLKVLASGKASPFGNAWNRLRLRMTGSLISVSIGDTELASVSDATYYKGIAGIGSGYNNARFDNLSVTPAYDEDLAANSGRNDPVAVASGLDKVDVFAVRANDHQMMWYTNQKTWISLGGLFTSQPAVVSRHQGLIDVFARGQDGRLWHLSIKDNRIVRDWESTGEYFITSAPSAVATSSDQIDIAARGKDNNLLHLKLTGGGSTWEDWGGLISSEPIIISSGSEKQLDAFARGMDFSLWHIARGKRVSDWSSLGGVILRTPSAVAHDDGKIDLFGISTNQTLFRNTFNGSHWSNWVSLGGQLKTVPIVKVQGSYMGVFGVGLDNDIWLNLWDGISWRWRGLNGYFLSSQQSRSLTVAVDRNANLHVYGIGMDSSLYYQLNMGPWTSIGKI